MQINALNVNKHFQIGNQKLVVLDQLSVNIENGKFICLLGPSGCGKSTFLRCIAGLDVPSSGEIMVDGKPVAGPGPDRAMVFQDYALFPWCNVADNIMFGLRLRKNRGRRDRPDAVVLDELIGLVGLRGFEKAYPHQISGGMRQRVGIARALAVDPGVLLMDEPFAAIDAITREQLQRQLLDTWEKTKKTIIFVTHSVEEAAFLADEVHVFGARPASIRESFVVDLPRPRDHASTAFADIASRMRASIDAGMQRAAS
ncbi:MAG: ABC transporter ATP-binding protein [Rhizobiales bacterium]|mgnify:CR=1 FL=1|nr:ABC transporter ATP-binding protein [Hyphomicrobiales bacterium]OJY47003.1 MAG: nitrate ABC transporter ATP-binding protein [Rhizobiales bacterium 64-17]